MRFGHLTATLIVPAVLAGGSFAADPTPPAPPPSPAPLPYLAAPSVRGMNDLVRMNRCELEALYRRSEMGCPPAGVTRGKAIYKPGSPITVPTSRAVRVLWQGKVFRDDIMRNRVLGLRVVPARVFVGESWLDGQPSIIMDYAGTSKLFPTVRDEIREVAPGLYLGIMYRRRDAGPELATFFVLEARRR